MELQKPTKKNTHKWASTLSWTTCSRMGKENF